MNLQQNLNLFYLSLVCKNSLIKYIARISLAKHIDGKYL